MKIDPNQLERLAAVMRRRRVPLDLKRLEREGLIRDAGRGWFEGHGPDDDDD